MLGTLTEEQSKYILVSHHVGRIGCYADGRIMVVPVTYVSDGKYIYAQSLEGTKINMMRKQPQVCFQVDSIDSLTNWRSVLVWGEYEELNSPEEQSHARKLIAERLAPLRLGQTVDPSREFGDPPYTVQKNPKPVMFRISIQEITGRFEK